VRIQAHLGDIEISFDLFGCQGAGGDDRIRTGDPLLAKQVLSPLSYIPSARTPGARARPSRPRSGERPAPRAASRPGRRPALERPEEWERQGPTSGFTRTLRPITSGFPPRLSRLPSPAGTTAPSSGTYSSTARAWEELPIDHGRRTLPHLSTAVAADSDLTLPQRHRMATPEGTP
jgi:hypothetical protein